MYTVQLLNSKLKLGFLNCLDWFRDKSFTRNIHFQVIHPKSDDQRRSLLEAVKEILLFRSLDGEQLGEVLDAMFEYKVKSGDYIIRQGDDGDNFYVVERGLYNIYVNTANGNQLVGKCEDSGSFGELALMYNSKYFLVGGTLKIIMADDLI